VHRKKFQNKLHTVAGYCTSLQCAFLSNSALRASICSSFRLLLYLNLEVDKIAQLTSIVNFVVQSELKYVHSFTYVPGTLNHQIIFSAAQIIHLMYENF